MTGNRKSRRRSNKLIRKAIEAYDIGGCPFCGRRPEDFARFAVGTDRLGQLIACCDSCAENRIVKLYHDAFKMPDAQGTQWAVHDKAFFELYPERLFHVREPWKQEAIILAKIAGGPECRFPLNAVLVVQIKPGARGRLLCPFLSPKEADEAGDEAIAAQTGRSVAKLFADLRLQFERHPSGRSMEAEKEHGLAWTQLFSCTPLNITENLG